MLNKSVFDSNIVMERMLTTIQSIDPKSVSCVLIFYTELLVVLLVKVTVQGIQWHKVCFQMLAFRSSLPDSGINCLQIRDFDICSIVAPS